MVGLGQYGLKSPNGSRQARHRYRTMQAVELKCEVSMVSMLPQRGQATDARAN